MQSAIYVLLLSQGHFNAGNGHIKLYSRLLCTILLWRCAQTLFR